MHAGRRGGGGRHGGQADQVPGHPAGYGEPGIDGMLHHEFRPKNYLYVHLNYTLHNNHLYDLYKGDDYWGCNTGYSFLSIAGPLRLELGYSGLSRKFHPYVSFGYHF